MKIITKEVQKAFDKQGDTSEKNTYEIDVVMKLFQSNYTAYVYEYNQEERLFFAYVIIGGDTQNAELGAISVDEIMRLRFPPFGLPIERDRYFKQQNLKEIIDIIQAGKHV